MFFLKGKEGMGLDASLALLDLSPTATIDDANQAYTHLHRMIDQFHRDNAAGHGDRQTDLELLACAYEKAVSYLSDQDSRIVSRDRSDTPDPAAKDASPSADLHFTINFPSSADNPSPNPENPLLSQNDGQTVANAIDIIARRLQAAESALDEARQAVVSATEALDAANRQLEKSKQARMGAVIAVESAKSRALLLDIEAQRAVDEVMVVAEKAKHKATAAKQAAKQAKVEADGAKDQIRRLTLAEEAAAAEVVCAEDRLEKTKQQFKALAHIVVQARSQLRVFEDYRGLPSMDPPEHRQVIPNPDAQGLAAPLANAPMQSQKEIMADLMEIENSLNERKQQALSPAVDRSGSRALPDPSAERRQLPRLYYPTALRPTFSFNGRSIPVHDLSQTGMGLEPDTEVGQMQRVRGAIVFGDLPTMNVTGKVVHQDEKGLGLRLVTRISNHVLDQERQRIGA